MANFNIKKNLDQREEEIGISFNFCNDYSKESIKRNKFYKQIRENLMRKKYEKYFKNKFEK